MLSDSTFQNLSRALQQPGDAALRDVAEEILSKKPEVPVEVREGEAFGPYRLGPRLGRGGMGEVFKAWDAELGRWVALKILRDAGAPLRLRFSRESIRLARLNHPNIVPVYRASQHGDAPYIAMAWIEGRTLDREELSVRESLEAVRTTARAIEFAHRQGIVHRDLKPQNIMMTEFRHIYVVDFGLAREAAEMASTVEGTVLGTPAYMAPEQARGRAEEIGTHTDVYALGATLYHLVTGRPPHQAEDMPALMLKIAGEEAAAPRRVRPNLHPDIEMIIQTAMEKSAGDRYPSAAELANDIDRFLEGEPILARPLPPGRRIWRWMQRNPAITASIMTAAPLVLTMAVAWLFMLDALKEAREAQDASLRIREQRYAELQALRSYRNAVQVIRGGTASHYTTALYHVDWAISLDPEVREYYELKAEILKVLGRDAEARAALDQAGLIPPN